MIIKINDNTSYDFASAEWTGTQIIGTTEEGETITLGGDIPNLEEILNKLGPTQPTEQEQLRADVDYLLML